jgi:ABC-2 type transport system permease protein
MRSICILLIVLAVGLLIGFRPEGTILNWGAALGLVLFINFLFIWFSALLGLLLYSVEAIQQAWMACTLPLLFASNAFVPTDTMPAWLRAFAEHQPLSVFITVVRGLLLNQPDATAIWQAVHQRTSSQCVTRTGSGPWSQWTASVGIITCRKLTG